VAHPTHVDPVNQHITIHKEDCGLVRPKIHKDQTTWFEEFDSVEAAEEFAREK